MAKASRKRGLQVGVATIDITPPVGVYLNGYHCGPRLGPSTSLGHPLRAEAMVVRGSDGACWALLSADIIVYPRDMVLRVRDRIAAHTELKAEAVLMAACHPHSAPTLGCKCDSELDTYDQTFEDRIGQVVIDAYEALAPATLEAALTEAPDLAHNRRVVQPDGTVKNEWDDPEGRHTGYYDPSVMLLGVRRPNGKLDALVVNYGCHPVTLGPESTAISSDYVGYMKDALEAGGIAGTAIFALGGAGEINPRVCIHKGEQYPRQMGEKLAEIVAAAAGGLKKVRSEPVASSLQPFWITTRRQFQQQDGQRGPVVETEILVTRAGDIGMVSLPGELFSEYVAMMRKASPMPHTLVISEANGSLGYFPVDSALARKGGIEVDGRVAAGGVEKLFMDTAHKGFTAVTSAR